VKQNLLVTQTGYAPADAEAAGIWKKHKLGSIVRSETTAMRNYRFHKKLFALLNLGFEYWEPAEIDCKHGVPEKNFEQFREDTIILAGFYKIHYRLDGSFRPKAKSISFARMGNDEFESLYQKVLTVLVKNIQKFSTFGADEESRKVEVNRVVDELLRFA